MLDNREIFDKNIDPVSQLSNALVQVISWLSSVENIALRLLNICIANLVFSNLMPDDMNAYLVDSNYLLKLKSFYEGSFVLYALKGIKEKAFLYNTKKYKKKL